MSDSPYSDIIENPVSVGTNVDEVWYDHDDVNKAYW